MTAALCLIALVALAAWRRLRAAYWRRRAEREWAATCARTPWRVAACVARFGEPSWQSAVPYRDDAWWPHPGTADDGAMVDGIALTRGANGLHMRAGRGGERALWPIASAADLTAALDAADAWRRP